MSVKILIYEDNTDFREALTQLLNSGSEYSCAGAFYNCRQIVEQVRELKPEVILMDIQMPDFNGLDGLHLIRRVNKDVKIIMLTVFDDNKNVLDAICAGASGYILKKDAFKKLFHSIDEVLEGGAPMSSNIAKLVLDFVTGSVHPAGQDFKLTIREKDILSSLVNGNSFKMIASTLDISPETVKTHIKNIYEKLQVHSQTEAVAKAIKNRIVK